MKKTLLPLLLVLIMVCNTKAQNNAPYWSLAGNSNAGPAKLGTTNGVHLRLFTNNAERMRITAGGLIGIGSTSPDAKLVINSGTTVDPLKVLVNNSPKFLVHKEGGASVGFQAIPPANGLLVNGNAGIGTPTPNLSFKLDVVNTSQEPFTGGISTAGLDFGLRADATGQYGYGIVTQGGLSGKGILSYGGFTGIETDGDWYGLYASSIETGVFGFGEYQGLFGFSPFGIAVRGDSDYGPGGDFFSVNSPGIVASTINGFFAGVFNGGIFSSGTFQASDKNMKKNVREFGDAMSILHQLKPIQYQYRTDAQYGKLSLPKGNHFGLVAQDVEKVLPDLVKESELTLPPSPDNRRKPQRAGELSPATALKEEKRESINVKSVNYVELVPLLIKAVQEQQETITSLTEKVAQLEAALHKNESGAPGTGSMGIILEQNQPNPVTDATTFWYKIPAGAQAQIQVYDSVSGRLLKTISAPASGKAEMNANDLPAGNYIYTLTVNGKVAASKHMVVAR
ncbi:tail fiber domain-containing protein [Sabulibacter ruber]|uniref:tail fiber domain-containing protein n=1 Tax=Sabulibacter ruber TaxID=2811901 RepID=UPI001A95EEF1|nr:tail fiber domain-containing protein [Sabulibacter ruber]